jgi:hypothetical protein
MLDGAGLSTHIQQLLSYSPHYTYTFLDLQPNCSPSCLGVHPLRGPHMLSQHSIMWPITYTWHVSPPQNEGTHVLVPRTFKRPHMSFFHLYSSHPSTSAAYDIKRPDCLLHASGLPGLALCLRSRSLTPSCPSCGPSPFVSQLVPDDVVFVLNCGPKSIVQC